MKLYATITSERGKPMGKGGSRFLKTCLNIGSAIDSLHVATLHAEYIDSVKPYVIITAYIAREGLFKKLQLTKVGSESIEL